MKPIRLEMTAFGPYKDAAAPIDFTAFGNGIYLITGDTGAGKTTIFDAIMFALFEEVSSKPVNSKTNNVDAFAVRTKAMLHSDYAPKDTDTVVRLVFEENGKRYTVKRTIRFSRKRGGGFNEAKFDAELTGDGCPAVTGSEKVTAEIVRILKLTSVQFRQIVMLAQGQFKAFMEAKDGDRKSILAGIFDSTPYRLFQEQFSGAAAKLDKQIKEMNGDIVRALAPESFRLPEDTDDATRALYAPDHPALEENILGLLKAEQEEDGRLGESLTDIGARIAGADRQYGAAEATNSLFDELQKKTDRLAELTAQEDAFLQLNRETGETATAVRTVRPAAERTAEAGKALDKEQDRLKGLLSDAETAGTALEAARAEADKNAERQTRERELTAQAGRIREHAAEIGQLADARKAHDDACRGMTETESKKKEAEARKAAAENRLKELGERLTPLADAEADEAAARAASDAARQLYEKLTRAGTGIRDRAAALIRDEAKLAQLTKEAAEASEKQRAADIRYGEVHSAYIAGYAGKLAADLENEIAANGSACCPVCSTPFTAGCDHRFARSGGETPSDADLKNAENARKKADADLGNAESAMRAAGAALDAASEALCRDADELLPDGAPWTRELLKSEELTNAVNAAERVCRAGAAAAGAASDALAEKKRLVNAQNETQAEKDRLTDEINRLTLAYRDRENTFNTSGEAMERLTGALTGADLIGYTSAEQAGEAALRLERQAQTLREETEAAANALSSAEKRLSDLNGAVRTQRNAVSQAEEKRRETGEAFTAAVTDAGFADEAAYLTALGRIGDGDGEAWIAGREKAYNDYRNERGNTEKRIAELREQTEGRTRTDLTLLAERRQQLKDGQEELRQTQENLHLRMEGHRGALNTVRKSGKGIARLSAAGRRLAALSGIANGSAGEGGVHAFDGYVLGYTFEEVLENAGRYLMEMTGGKYQLVHDTEALRARQNASADFRIMVDDTLTGQSREIGSISGGESFQVSMALALGLSDTVQNHASTVKINTMFIDEGFGQLDSNSLTQMLSVLSSLSGGERQIGIISHVDALEEHIQKYIRVTGSKDKNGSRLVQEY